MLAVFLLLLNCYGRRIIVSQSMLGGIMILESYNKFIDSLDWEFDADESSAI